MISINLFISIIFLLLIGVISIILLQCILPKMYRHFIIRNCYILAAIIIFMIIILTLKIVPFSNSQQVFEFYFPDYNIVDYIENNNHAIIIYNKKASKDSVYDDRTMNLNYIIISKKNCAWEFEFPDIKTVPFITDDHQLLIVTFPIMNADIKYVQYLNLSNKTIKMIYVKNKKTNDFSIPVGYDVTDHYFATIVDNDTDIYDIKISK